MNIQFAPYIGPNFLLIDKIRPNTARLVRNYMLEELPIMACPAQGPDFNPIEHVAN